MKIKTVPVSRNLYSNYIIKADEFMAAAQRSFFEEEWNAAAAGAIHSAISAVDALCVYFLGIRHAGEKHDDAVNLFKTIKIEKEELDKNARRISRVLSYKNMAEYEERLVYKSEAENALKDAERILSFVKSKLPKQ
jgi:HEPN domain-containing protein